MIQSDWQHIRKTPLNAILIPITLTIQALLLPGNYSLIASIYLYPIYREYHLNVSFIQGAWITLYSILWMVKLQINKEFDAYIFKLTTESSLWCYISHSLFSLTFLTIFVVPFKNSFPMFLAIVLNFIFTEVMCMITYFLLVKIHSKFKR